jgi:hypothetical protein
MLTPGTLSSFSRSPMVSFWTGRPFATTARINPFSTSRGLTKLPDRFHRKLDEAKIFSYTAYSFPGLMAVCEKLARQVLMRSGGRIEQHGGEEIFVIPVKAPIPSPFEDIKNPLPVANSVFAEAEKAG